MAGSDCKRLRIYRPNVKHLKSCIECGVQFMGRHCIKHCCRGCGRRRSARLRRQSKPVVVKSYRGNCPICSKQFTKPTKTTLYCSQACVASAYEWAPEVRICIGCLFEFTQSKRWQRRCSPTCITPADAACKRKAKSRRRAITRGLKADSIDPIAVFHRDGWRCHICLRLTSQMLRGTCKARAPELDHLVSLAHGGTHTWGNVACSCRECNQAKGSRSMGQLGFDLAA